MRNLVATLVLASIASSTTLTLAGSPARQAVKVDPSALSAGNECHKLPPGKRIVKLNLKPDTDLPDLVAWISSITCKEFILPGSLSARSSKISIFAPQLITPEEAYRLFLDALDSAGLTVYPTGHFLRVIEIAKAKSSPIPTYTFDDSSH